MQNQWKFFYIIFDTIYSNLLYKKSENKVKKMQQQVKNCQKQAKAIEKQDNQKETQKKQDAFKNEDGQQVINQNQGNQKRIINIQHYKRQIARLGKMSHQNLIMYAYNLGRENKRLQNRLADFQPQKQKLLKSPNPKKIGSLFQEFESRKFALKICYIGMSYDGMAVQIDTKNTIQQHLFKVLYTLSLTQNSMPGIGYTRAGRTDKGVSAMGNVCALPLRTNIKTKNKNQILQQNIQATHQKGQIKKKERKPNNPLNYCSMINALLPQDIRILACTQVAQQFNARYHCTKRSYKYFFAKNNLNIQLMQEAIKLFVGTHNFTNYCKINLSNTINFQRTIMQAQIRKASNDQIFMKEDDRNQIYYFYYVGNSFLWHQIRFMSSILFMVGCGQQKPSIVTELFDKSKYPTKPNYCMAPEYALILQDCLYDNIKFELDQQNAISFYNTFNEMVMRKSVQKTLLINCMMMAKNQLLNNIKLSESAFLTQSRSRVLKILTRKKKSLAIHKASGRGIDEAIKSLKGKKLDLYQKKAQKQAQYEERRKKQVQNQQQGSAQVNDVEN